MTVKSLILLLNLYLIGRAYISSNLAAKFVLYPVILFWLQERSGISARKGELQARGSAII